MRTHSSGSRAGRLLARECGSDGGCQRVARVAARLIEVLRVRVCGGGMRGKFRLLREYRGGAVAV